MSERTVHHRRRTSERVHFWDRVSTGVITFGGVGVLAAVLGLCVYLLWVVAPLFVGARVSAGAAGSTPATAAVLVRAFDEDARAMLTLDSGGRVRAVSLAVPTTFFDRQLLADPGPSAATEPQRDGQVALGFTDGTLRLGTIALSDGLASDSTVPVAMRSLAVSGEAVLPGDATSPPALLLHPEPDRFRVLRPAIDLGEPIHLKLGNGAVVRADLKISPAGQRYLVALRADGTVVFATVRTVQGLAAKKSKDTLDEVVVPFDAKTALAGLSADPASGPWVFVTSDGASVLILSADGTLRRAAISRTGGVIRAALADEWPLLARASPRLDATTPRITAAAMLQGGLTLVAGDSTGRLHSVTVGRDPTSPTPDSMRLVRAASIDLGAAGVVTLAVSPRDRLVAAALADGTLVVRHMTSRKEVARIVEKRDASALAILPKGDGLFATAAAGAQTTYNVWRLVGGFPEASAVALFMPLVYEGQIAPSFTYQSSGGNESSESKMSVVPLIFGTLKATVVAMLFAVPLAVLAAIYTSEFLTPRVRRTVKPAVEMMASLPSVVLGFIAALVVAPFVAAHLAAVLASIVVVPVGLLAAAHVWQVMPPRTMMLVGRRWRAGLIAIAIAALVLLAGTIGPIAERILFAPTAADRLVAAGHFEPVPREQWPAWVGQRPSMSADDERALRRKSLYFRDGRVVRPVADADLAAVTAPEVQGGLVRWLNGTIGTARPGWVVILTLPMIIVAWFGLDRALAAARVTGRVGASARDPAGRRRAAAMFELVRFIASVVAGALAAMALAHALATAGIDPRDSLLGPFSQRNALVVGLIMGFAIIPIIYTISEDALRSVPASLRSASLGVGATLWQTAVRVVLPAAGSGVFSACMIGLGRAVGETMIVLMATGNTPEMTPNIFSGFRTLAANIAVELPEAERGGTHYRVLFLCGLTLFVMTFVVNTTAEIVRQRFRKRTAAL